MASNFDSFHLVLQEIQNELDKYIEEERTSELPRLSSNIDVLSRDWRFLRMLWESIQGQRDCADKQLVQLQQQEDLEQEGRELESKSLALALKIEAAVEEILRDLVCLSEIKKHDKGSSKYSESVLLQLMVDCQIKTDQFITEITEAVDYHISGCSFQVHPPPPVDVYFSTSFVDSVMLNLWSVYSTVHLFDDDEVDRGSLVLDKKQVFASFKELELIRDYVLEIIRGHRDVTLIISKAFPTRIASLFVRVANQACSYWFSYKTDQIQLAKIKLTKLVKDLQNEIDPTNPKFMELHLNFLSDLYGIHGDTFCVHSFCDYLHTWRANIYLEQELSSLLVDFFNTKLEEEKSGTDVKSFFAEIIAVLVEAFSLWEVLRKQDESEPPPCSQLLIKICLLKAELFLKGILCNRNSTNTFFYLLFDNSHIQKLKDILENLRRYSHDILTEKIKYGKKSLELIEELTKGVAFLCQSFEGEKITESTVKNSLFELLLKIVLSKAESVLMEFISSNSGNTSFLAHGKQQIGLLLDQLNFITLVLPNQQMKDRDDVDMIFVQVEAFARGVTHFCRSFAPKKITKNMISQMILSSSQLLQKVKHVKPKLKEIANQIPLSNFPETYRRGFIDFLVRNIQDLLKHDPGSIAPVKTHIEDVQLHLQSLSSFLLKISEMDIQQPKVKELGNHIAELAYKLEYVIDSIEIDAHWQHFFWFYDLLEELRLVAKQASLIRVFAEGAGFQNSIEISQNVVS